MSRRRTGSKSSNAGAWLLIIGALVVISSLGPVIVKVLLVVLTLAGMLLLVFAIIMGFELIAWLTTRRPLVSTTYVLHLFRSGSHGSFQARPHATLASPPELADNAPVRLTVSLAGRQTWQEALRLTPVWQRAFIRGIRHIGHGDKAREELQRARAQCPAEYRPEITRWLGLIVANEGDLTQAVEILGSVTGAYQSSAWLFNRVQAAYLVARIGCDSTIVNRSLEYETAKASAVALAACEYATGNFAAAARALAATEYHADRLTILVESEDWHGVIDATGGTRNESDQELNDLLLRARAFRELRQADAALAVYDMCVESRRRDPTLLTYVRYERGKTLLATGRRAQARRDLARVYAENHQFEDIAALMKDLETEPVNGRGREPVPREIKDRVWRRDGGKCVECGSQERLEFDHIIPLAMGGSNTERNLQLLCETCNRTKGAQLV
jgi:tetratricopeptide (TPR) repeat protein